MLNSKGMCAGPPSRAGPSLTGSLQLCKRGAQLVGTEHGGGWGDSHTGCRRPGTRAGRGPGTPLWVGVCVSIAEEWRNSEPEGARDSARDSEQARSLACLGLGPAHSLLSE